MDVTQLTEHTNDRRETPWGEYVGNDLYSADAQIVMDVCAAFLSDEGRLPTLGVLAARSRLHLNEIEEACDQLGEMGWLAYAQYAEFVRSRSPIGRRLISVPVEQEDDSRTRRPIPTELRAMVWAKSGGVCWYCGAQTNPFANFHIDHFIPVSDGGTNHQRNLVPSCQRCNSEKGAKHIEAFRAKRGGCIFWFERVAK